MRHLSSHANAFTQRLMRMNRLADVYCVCTHFDSKRDLADHFARVDADYAAAGDASTAPARLVDRSASAEDDAEQFAPQLGAFSA